MSKINICWYYYYILCWYYKHKKYGANIRMIYIVPLFVFYVGGGILFWNILARTQKLKVLLSFFFYYSINVWKQPLIPDFFMPSFIISSSILETSGRSWLQLHSSSVCFLPDAHHQRGLAGRGLEGGGGYTRTYCTSRSHQSMKCDGKKCERGYYRLRVNSVEPSPAPKDVWTLTNSHLLHSSTPPSHPFFKTICPWGAYATQRSNTNSTACAQNNPICSTGATEEWAKR